MTARGACLRRPADVSEEAAAEILLPSIEKLMTIFSKAGFEHLQGIEIVVSAKEGGSGRNFAACRTDGRLLVLSPDLIHLPQATVEGILAHELGHAVDFSYPARVGFGKGGAIIVIDDSKKGVTTGQPPIPQAWLDDWDTRSNDAVEGFADKIAEAVTGWRIGYAGPCLLQTVGKGIRPRPKGLR